MKILNSTIAKGKQDVILDSIYEHLDHKLRVKIRSESYMFQCLAYIEIFTDNGWKNLHSIHYGIMNTPKGLYYKPGLEGLLPYFSEDVETLLHCAELILGGSECGRQVV